MQLQIPGKNMPVEDPTVLWSEQDSPFLPVARITIPKQVFDTPEQDRFCEDLSFTPWHALPEHEPVGGLNRLRKAVYLEISRYRHARNGSAARRAARLLPRPHGCDVSGRHGRRHGRRPAGATPGAAAAVAPARGTALAPAPASKAPTAAAPRGLAPLPSPVVAKPGTEAPPPSTAPEAVPNPAPDSERVPPPPESEPDPN